jgi:hypothetical protein
MVPNGTHVQSQHGMFFQGLQPFSGMLKIYNVTYNDLALFK